MRFTLRQIEVFREVAMLGSYTAAAEKLHLTQPAVFAQVRQLEAWVGKPLIERIGRALRVTETGRAVLRSAETLASEVERLGAELAAIKGLSAGRIDLAVVSTAKYTLPWLIGPFCKAHPGVDVRLTVGNRSDLLERFAANRDDLYVLGTVPPDLAAEQFVLAENPIVVVAPLDHPLVGRKAIELTELAAQKLVMREAGSGTRRAADALFQSAGLAPQVRLELGAYEAVKQAVMAGLGVAILSRGTVKLELDHGYLAELDVQGFPLMRQWSLLWNPHRHASAATVRMRDDLRARSG